MYKKEQNEGPYGRKLLSRKPHTRTKHHVDQQNQLRSYGHFVYPRWLLAAILDFIELQIAPFDPSTPKTLA